jgi:hypothetical protein
MKKSIVIGIIILSIFIISSLSYQPIIADESIVFISQVKESKKSVNKIDSYRDVYNRIVEIKSQFDCDCLLYNYDNTFICYTLLSILFVLYSLFSAFNVFFNIQALQQLIYYLLEPLESFTEIIYNWVIYYDCVGGFP